MVENKDAQAGRTSGASIFLILFLALIAAGTWAAYTHGEGYLMINGHTVSELEPWEVIGGVIIGLVGLMIGLAGGLVGLLVGLLATVMAITLALVGVAAGLFITAGVLLGPFLLIAAIVLLMRRKPSGATAYYDS